MLKLKHYFKKFWAPILLCVGLLFLQSQSELALPDYMSDIVSVGIQAGGFDSAVSDVLSEETYNHLLVLMDEEDQQKLVEPSNLDKDTLDKFPKAKGQNIYKLKDLSEKKLDRLESILDKPMLMVTSIDGMDKNSKEYQEQFGQLPPNMTPYDALAMMDNTTKAKMFSKIDSQMETMGESTLKIAAGNGVKAEYSRLGCDTDKIQNDYILWSGLKMLAIALAGTVCAVACGFLASKVGAGVSRLLRRDVFEKVESFSNGEFNKFSTASLITRTTNDITQVQMVVIMFIRIVCFAPMMGIGALIKAFNNTPSMTWIIGLVLLVIFCLIGVTFAIVMPKFKIVQSLIDRLNLTMRENLSGMLVIRAFGNEKHSEERFEKANGDLTNVNLFVNRTMASLMPIMMFIFNVVTLLIVYYGAKQIDLGNIAIGQMMAFMQYAMQIIMSFLMIAMISIMLPRASVAADRIYEVISMEPKIVDPKEPKAFIESKKGLVEFNNVTFKYPGANEAVLENISFTVVKGEIFALLGTNGAGKTTTLECLEGIRRYDTGKILINGKLGVQLQSSSLPADITAKEAIMLFAKWQDLEVTDDYFIYLGIKAFLKKQYHQLSTGQKRRLHLAIALLGHPDIIVLDEPTAGLDVEGRNSIHQEIKRLKTQGKTILLASHDMTEVEELCDRIGVLNHGKIVFIGAPDQLHQTMQSKFKLKVRFSKVPRLNEQFEIVSQEQEYYIFETTNLEITLKAIIQLTEEQSIKIMEINTVQPKLEERFLKEVQS